MLKATKPRLFPLHLAPIDEFFLLDDRPDHPMTFASHMFLSGEASKEAFDTALVEALELHPILRAYIRPAKRGKLCFVQTEEAFPQVDWDVIGKPIAFAGSEGIDLAEEVGLRVWVRTGEGRTEIVVQFHHACCDGTGAHRFIGDLLAAYGRLTTTEGKVPATATYNPQLLKRRRLKLADTITKLSTSSIIRRGLGEGVHVFGRKIAPLSLTSQDHTDPDDEITFPGVVSVRFDKDQHQALREAARRMGGMLNDLLMAEMFQTMIAWNVGQSGRRKQHVRIMMPSDMRDKEDFQMPASNMTSYNFITRNAADCDNSADLLRSIRDETARIKHEERGRRFIDSIMGARKIPWLLPLLLSGRRCLSTVTLSNMGDPTRRFLATFPRQGGKLVAGNLVLDHMVGVSPLRPQTRAAVSIVSLYRELHINVRCDPHVMSTGDARAFLDLYGARLSWHIGDDSVNSTVEAKELVTAR
jgi:hypothetical protein